MKSLIRRGQLPAGMPFPTTLCCRGLPPAVRPRSPTRPLRSGPTLVTPRRKSSPDSLTRNGLELRTHDRFGQRIDWVEFRPAWHELHGARLSTRSSLARLDDERGERPSRPRRDVIPRPSTARVCSVARRQTPASGCTEGWRQHRLRDDREAGRLRSPPDPDHGAFP
jgi:hypothetical protein